MRERAHPERACGTNMDDRTATDEQLPVIARFEVRRRRYLAPDGSSERPLPAFARDRDLPLLSFSAVVFCWSLVGDSLDAAADPAVAAFRRREFFAGGAFPTDGSVVGSEAAFGASCRSEPGGTSSWLMRCSP